MSSMKNLEDSYLSWLLSDGLAESNLPFHSSRFKEFTTYCITNGIAVETVNVEIVRNYLTWLAQRPNRHNPEQLLTTSTRAKHYDFLKRFGIFLGDKGIIPDPNITEGVRRPVPRKTSIQSFSQEQLQAIFDAVGNARSTPQYKERTVLLIFTLVSTGVRINESLPLKPTNYDFDRRFVTVIGKGNKERDVPFSKEYSQLIQDFIERYGIKRDDYIFASRYGRPLSAVSVRDALRRIKQSLGSTHGIDRMRVSPHTFRHTFARLWVIKGGNTIALSRILGHTSTQMTDNYVRLWGVDLNDAYDLCDPCSGILVPEIKRN